MKVSRNGVPVILVLVMTMLFSLTACQTTPENPAKVVESNNLSRSGQATAMPEQAGASQEQAGASQEQAGASQEQAGASQEKAGASPEQFGAIPEPGQPEGVLFSDPVLEAIVRASIGKPIGDILVDDVNTITRLDLANAYQRYFSDETVIRDIKGLESFTSLETLDLSSHQIRDITPLKGLHGLRHLILDDNPMTDISPLAGLSDLRLLALSGCKAVDYSPISNLSNLQYLRLDHSTLADVAPLVSLTNLTHLYLSGSLVKTYQPLSELYVNLVQSDFAIAYTLSELGFGRDRYENQANFDGEEASVRINHAEWGPVSDSRWMENCVRTVFVKNGYKVGTGYYPRQDAYIMTAHQDGEFVLNYTYDNKTSTFTFDEDTAKGNREEVENMVRAIYSDVDAEDVLLTPIKVYQDTLARMFGLDASALFDLPFDENDNALPNTPYEKLGFALYRDLAKCEYVNDSITIHVHRPEWDKKATVELVDWNISFVDKNVHGYQLSILFFDAEDKYLMLLEKDGREAWLNVYARTGEKEYDPNGITLFNEAFNTKGNAGLEKPLEYYEQVIQDCFGMNSKALYALPLRE